MSDGSEHNLLQVRGGETDVVLRPPPLRDTENLVFRSLQSRVSLRHSPFGTVPSTLPPRTRTGKSYEDPYSPDPPVSTGYSDVCPRTHPSPRWCVTRLTRTVRLPVSPSPGPVLFL